MTTIPSPNLDTLITKEEAEALRKFVEDCRKGQARPTVHNCVMAWMDRNEAVSKRAATHGLIKAYTAYLFEYALDLK